MVLYKPDCDSNDCELPSGQATPSTSSIARDVAYWGCMRGGLLIEYNICMSGKMASQSVSAGSFMFESVGESFAWLGVGRLTVDSKYWRRFISISTSRLPVYAGKVRDWDRERIWACAWAEGAWSCVILLIAYSFTCDSFDCELWKNSQFAIKRISQSKSDLRY